MSIRAIGILAFVILLALPVSGTAQVRGNVYLKTLRVTAVPAAPGGDFWDGDARAWGRFVGSLIRNESASFYPDIEVCIGSRAGCKLVCVNAQLNADDPNLRPKCGLQFEAGLLLGQLVDVNGQPQWRTRDLLFEVNEIAENGDTTERRTMGRLMFYAGADPPILQPDRCSESEPCTRSMQTPRGPLNMEFTTVFAGVVGTLARTNPPGPAPGPNTPPPPAPGGQPGEPSYWDSFKKWWEDFIWDKAKEPAGWRGTVLEGLADQAKIANDKYAERLVAKIKEHGLESRLETVCQGRTGKDAASCAYQVLAEDYPADAQWAQTGELTVGFLANMWKSVCGVFKMTCN
jgi:hypothetical protein